MKILNLTNPPSGMGITEEDIKQAFFHYCYDGRVEYTENKYLCLGFDRYGNLLEIMYTEEEAWALDEEVTKNPPRVDPAKARRVSHMVAVDDFSAEYLMAVSIATHKRPTEIISKMVGERIAASL